MKQATIEKIKQHYNHAREKHPYFCDSLLPEGRSLVSLEKEVEENLENARLDIESAERLGRLIPQILLNCEVWEINEAIVDDNITAAVEECYDAIAVLLRIVDVLEGRQALGDPAKKGVTDEQ
jgi:hypothetical protein